MNYLWAFMILLGIVYAALNGTLPDVTDAALNSAKEAVTLCVTMLGVMSFWVGLMRIAEKTGMVAGLSKRLSPFLRFLFPGLPKEHEANKYIAANMIANFLGLGWAATPAGLKAMEALAQLEEERRGGTSPSGIAPTGQRRARERGKEDGLRGTPPTVQRRARERGKEDGLQGTFPKGKCLRSRAWDAFPPGTASNEMCTFLIINISSLQLIPVNIIAYRSQYGSVDPAAIVGPAIVATAVSTGAAVIFCRIMNGKRGVCMGKPDSP